MAASAPSPDTVVAVIKKANGGKRNCTAVEEILLEYANLSPLEQDKVRPLFVTKVFPLVFGDNAFVRGSDDYAIQQQVPWSTNCWLEPQVIVTPTTAQQVAAALALCIFFIIKFSIRGGGHLHNPGFNSNDGGVVISLGQFEQVRLSEDKSTADIGLGLRWLDVYEALEPEGLAVAGGRMPTVGVPGLILGGGISFQNSQYGVGAMAVANYEVVLADLSIVNANAQENPDLFWALKGGGPNFGIVTRMDMATVPNQIWSESRIYPPTAYNQLVEALMEYHEAIETDDQATLIWHATGESIMLVYVYCSPVDNPSVFAPFYDIPFTMNFVEPGIRSIYDLVQAVASVVSSEPMLHEFRTMSSRPSIEVYKAIENARAEQVLALQDLKNVTLTTVFQPMSSLAMKQSASSPLGLEPAGQQWFLAMGDWANAADEERVRAAVKNIVDVAEKVARENGAYLDYKYSNYAARDQDALAGYGEENIERMRRVARKYDPFGVFQNLQGGGWLLSKIGSV
ncbi:FAD-binding domain-containing protein [Aspergillus cavernicola]|uniref:FAD-binding domain-containing protein n=1 Tax=Aspergillus cavernicola TaxID=176166 RepID=A0ABR4I0V7_9EURO